MRFSELNAIFNYASGYYNLSTYIFYLKERFSLTYIP